MSNNMKTKIIIAVLFLLASTAFYAFKSDVFRDYSESADAFERYVEGEKVEFKRSIDDVSYSLIYVSHEQMRNIAMKHSQVSGTGGDSNFEEYGKNVFFKLNVLKKSYQGDHLKEIASDPKDYSSLVQLCSFGASELFQLVHKESGNIVFPSYINYEQSYGFQPGLNWLVSFPIDEVEMNEYTFQFNDELFNNGPVKISIQ